MNTVNMPCVPCSNMELAPSVVGRRCPGCAIVVDSEVDNCPECGGPSSFTYDLNTEADRLSVTDRNDLWRYERFLPLAAVPEPTRKEGNTPLCGSSWLREELGVSAAYIKDEGRNPTGHCSDRDMAVVGQSVHSRDNATVSISSPGRSAVATAAAAASHGVDCVAYVPSRAPFGVKALVNVHGADMTVVPGRYAEARRAYEDSATDTDWVAAGPTGTPLAREGRKTIYFEILEALDWTVPDIVVVPAGSGIMASAIAIASEQTRQLGLVDRIPRIGVIQPAGCAPIVEAVQSGSSVSEWASPDTICGELEIPIPGSGDQAVRAVEKSGGSARSVPDPAALEAAVQIAQQDGLEVSVAGGVGIAGATDLEDLDQSDTVVVINPGSASIDADVLRSHLMGQGV